MKFFSGILAMLKAEKITRALRLAGYDATRAKPRDWPVGQLAGEDVRLSYFFDDSSMMSDKRQYVGTMIRLVITVGGVDLSCEDGPHYSLALAWARLEADRVQNRLEEERARMLEKIHG